MIRQLRGSIRSLRKPHPTVAVVVRTAAVDAALADAHYDIACDPELADVVAAIVDGKEILAVKLYRDRPGVPIGQAKVAVDHLRAQVSARACDSPKP
jgi:ribosomal protein L7/L12